MNTCFIYWEVFKKAHFSGYWKIICIARKKIKCILVYGTTFFGVNGNNTKCGAKGFLVPFSVLLTWHWFWRTARDRWHHDTHYSQGNINPCSYNLYMGGFWSCFFLVTPFLMLHILIYVWRIYDPSECYVGFNKKWH